MGKNKSSDSETREHIIAMYRNNKSYSEIAKTIKCSKSMVYNAVQHFLAYSTTENISRKRRPKITTTREDALIVCELQKNPYKSAREIKETVFGTKQLGPSVDTIKRRLRNVELLRPLCHRKSVFSQKNRKDRLAFAKKYQDWTVAEWKKVLFSGETKINMVVSGGRGCPQNTEFDLNAHETLEHEGESIMLWGGISWCGIGPIHKINSAADQFYYASIQSDVLVPNAAHNLLVMSQKDSKPKHTARPVEIWESNHFISLLDWPSCSLDLNPIENLWTKLKAEVGQHKMSSSKELFAKARETWHNIPIAECQSLIESMPRRCQAVIDSNGFVTKYTNYY